MSYFMYVSLQGDDKILTFNMDAATGKLTPVRELALSGGPAPLAADPDRRFPLCGAARQQRTVQFPHRAWRR